MSSITANSTPTPSDSAMAFLRRILDIENAGHRWYNSSYNISQDQQQSAKELAELGLIEILKIRIPNTYRNGIEYRSTEAGRETAKGGSKTDQNSNIPAPKFQITSPEDIRAILAKATVYNAAGIAEAAVRLNARALEFAALLPPWEQQIAMQYVAEAEVAQCGRVAFCRVAREAVRSFWPIGGKRFGAMDYERVPFVSGAVGNVRPEQIVRL